MAQRGHEGPMDFQYDGGGQGPRDPNSAFNQAIHVKKRPLSVLQSAASSKPTLTPPVSQPFLFSKPSFQEARSLQPQIPSFKPTSTALKRSGFDMSQLTNNPDIFSTARKENKDLDNIAIFPRRSPKPIIFTGVAPTRITGRGEVPRGRYHDGAITKVRRRRHIRRPSTVRFHSDDDSESDTNLSEHGHASPGWRSHASAWVSTHREVPAIASQYLQVMTNLSLVLLLLYGLFCFYLTIRNDVDQKVLEFSSSIIAETNRCARLYTENRCAPHLRVPALERDCANWDRCMNRDPLQVGRARVSAETFAEIINSFIEPISYKTMLFVLLSVFATIFTSNFAFGFYRAKALNHPTPFLAAAAPPIADRLEQRHPEEYQHVPDKHVPAKSTGVNFPRKIHVLRRSTQETTWLG